MTRLGMLWHYYGAAGAAAKLRDKLVTEPRRFRDLPGRPVPTFPPHTEPLPLPVPTGRSMRICFLLHCFYPERRGGTERFVLNMAKAMQSKGHKVGVLTLSVEPSSAYSGRLDKILFREYLYDGIPVTAFRYLHTPPGLFYKRMDGGDGALRRFAAHYLDSHGVELVHCAYPQPFAAFLAVCRARRVPYLVTLTDFNILCHYATMVDKAGQFCSGCQQGMRCNQACPSYGVGDARIRYRASRALLEGASGLTAPSAFVASVAEQEYPGLCVRVVPHGLSGAFSPGPPRRAVRRFVYAGTMAPMKGVHLLVAAFRRLSGDLALELYGGGDPAYLRRLQHMARGDPRICFHGPAAPEQMPEIFRAADCVVVPSIWFETYNFVLREALRCGCLGVAANIGALPEAVAEGKNGFFFPPGSAEGLREALARAVEFDWTGYRPSPSPTVEAEAERYEAIYAFISVGTGGAT